jgi:hypothetical protein
VLGDDVPFEDLVATVTRLWANALRLPMPAAAKPPRKRAAAKAPA